MPASLSKSSAGSLCHAIANAKDSRPYPGCLSGEVSVGGGTKDHPQGGLTDPYHGPDLQPQELGLHAVPVADWPPVLRDPLWTGLSCLLSALPARWEPVVLPRPTEGANPRCWIQRYHVVPRCQEIGLARLSACGREASQTSSRRSSTQRLNGTDPRKASMRCPSSVGILGLRLSYPRAPMGRWYQWHRLVPTFRHLVRVQEVPETPTNSRRELAPPSPSSPWSLAHAAARAPRRRPGPELAQNASSGGDQWSVDRTCTGHWPSETGQNGSTPEGQSAPSHARGQGESAELAGIFLRSSSGVVLRIVTLLT